MQPINPPACFEHLKDCKFPKTVAPDDAIAGLGIFAVFVANAALCLAGTYAVVWARFYHESSQRSSLEPRKQRDTWVWVAANGIGDVQLFAGIAVSLSAFILLKNSTITAYHYDLACYLGISATFTALTTVFVWPELHAHFIANCTRLVALIISIVLLGLNLAPVSAAGTSFPGRAPIGTIKGDTALVLEAKCFLKQHVPKDCGYTTDRSPYPFISGVWILFPLSFILLTGLATKFGEASNWYHGTPNANQKKTNAGEIERQGEQPKLDHNEDLEYATGHTKGRKVCNVHVGKMFVELSAITLAFFWAIAALWQYYHLRQYMNGTGWLSTPAETAVDSFSQLVPIIQIFSTLLFVACALDKWFGNRRAARKQDEMVEAERVTPKQMQTIPPEAA